MTIPIQISFRDLVPLPSLEPAIHRRASKLEQWAPDVMSCHVVVESTGNRHHKGHDYRVKIVVHVAGAELVANAHHHDEDIYRVVSGAFDAIDRQLEDHVRKRRGQVKHHELPVGDDSSA
jgi:ribosomal subunit interface protein